MYTTNISKETFYASMALVFSLSISKVKKNNTVELTIQCELYISLRDAKTWSSTRPGIILISES
jgi:hypothetical protein